MLTNGSLPETDRFDYGEFQPAAGPRRPQLEGYVPFVTHRVMEIDLPNGIYKHPFDYLYSKAKLVDPTARMPNRKRVTSKDRQVYEKLMQQTNLRSGDSIITQRNSYERHFKESVDVSLTHQVEALEDLDKKIRFQTGLTKRLTDESNNTLHLSDEKPIPGKPEPDEGYFSKKLREHIESEEKLMKEIERKIHEGKETDSAQKKASPLEKMQTANRESAADTVRSSLMLSEVKATNKQMITEAVQTDPLPEFLVHSSRISEGTNPKSPLLARGSLKKPSSSPKKIPVSPSKISDQFKELSSSQKQILKKSQLAALNQKVPLPQSQSLTFQFSNPPAPTMVDTGIQKDDAEQHLSFHAITPRLIVPTVKPVPLKFDQAVSPISPGPIMTNPSMDPPTISIDIQRLIALSAAKTKQQKEGGDPSSQELGSQARTPPKIGDDRNFMQRNSIESGKSKEDELLGQIRDSVKKLESHLYNAIAKKD